jgi:hypothetical protein
LWKNSMGILSFPNIISGCIGDVALPRQESRQRHQTVGLLDARARAKH